LIGREYRGACSKIAAQILQTRASKVHMTERKVPIGIVVRDSRKLRIAKKSRLNLNTARSTNSRKQSRAFVEVKQI